MVQDSGGHFKILEALSYNILIDIIQICCMVIISLLKNTMTLCPPTGNTHPGWLMHYGPRVPSMPFSHILQLSHSSHPVIQVCLSLVFHRALCVAVHRRLLYPCYRSLVLGRRLV